MGIHLIKMPDIGEGIAEVELVEWHVQPGDAVAEDQVLADVMTDKATVQVPSPVHGTVLSLGGKVGDVMAVGADLIRITVDGAGNVGDDSEADPLPQPLSRERERGVEREMGTSSPLPFTGEGARRAGESQPDAPHTPGEKPTASPSVRYQARTLGIDLRLVRGSGPHGRIVHADLEAYAAGASTAPSAAVTAASPPPHPAVSARDERTLEIPVVGLRRRIAQKMQDSKRHIPHFTYVEEIDITEVETLRAQLNAQWGATRGKLTLLPFLARAMVLALRDFPHINARYDDEAQLVTQYQAVHLGLATQADQGLMVPVLRHAQALDLWQCAAEITRLAQAARTGKAAREELSGSTITLSSLGALGGIVATPIINHPEVAIVGVNRIVEKPVVRDGAVVVRKTMNLSSSFDHRVVDGMHAAQFIQAVRRLLECPALMFVG